MRHKSRLDFFGTLLRVETPSLQEAQCEFAVLRFRTNVRIETHTSQSVMHVETNQNGSYTTAHAMNSAR